LQNYAELPAWFTTLIAGGRLCGRDEISWGNREEDFGAAIASFSLFFPQTLKRRRQTLKGRRNFRDVTAAGG